ncbi:MAG: prepilin-type N-terminal cleavage/methylation domain-containing protein [Leptolyngbyaceae cyanobacterium SM1_3_5]|nr:prepilin-type N-terminal cleavage/methylation domain-containing protein [Leptolyngbyaceae cyanobacterium SM1_3_5]
MRKKLLRSSAAGFTLIELIAVMVMIGVLFSIAAPGWLAFANRQRVNSVRDELLQEIRRTQTLAAQTRLSQQFTVIPGTADAPPKVQVARPSVTVGSQARELGSGQIEPGVIQIEFTNNIQWIEFDEKEIWFLVQNCQITG